MWSGWLCVRWCVPVRVLTVSVDGVSMNVNIEVHVNILQQKERSQYNQCNQSLQHTATTLQFTDQDAPKKHTQH